MSGLEVKPGYASADKVCDIFNTRIPMREIYEGIGKKRGASAAMAFSLIVAALQEMTRRKGKDKNSVELIMLEEFLTAKAGAGWEAVRALQMTQLRIAKYSEPKAEGKKRKSEGFASIGLVGTIKRTECFGAKFITMRINSEIADSLRNLKSKAEHSHGHQYNEYVIE